MKHRTVAAVALALAAACRSGDKAAPGRGGDELFVDLARIDRGEVRVVTVQEQTLTQAVIAAGRVAFDDQRVQHVLAPVTGRITRVLASPASASRRARPSSRSSRPTWAPPSRTW